MTQTSFEDDYIIDESLYNIDDHVIMVPDFNTGGWIQLGYDEDFCSAKLEGLGTPELRSSEINIPGRDGSWFGAEYFGMRKWTISGAIKSGLPNAPGDPAKAWESLRKLMRAWDYNRARTTTRQVIPLVWKRPGRETTVIYGRPERIDPDVSMAHAGFISYTAVFRQSDPKIYSGDARSVAVAALPSYSGGLIMNSTRTALFAVNGKMQTSQLIVQPIVVERDPYMGEDVGDADTNPVITIAGPILNPRVTLKNEYGGVLWSVSLDLYIEKGQRVVIDTRSWEQSVLLNQKYSVAGLITSPRLADITIPVGTWTVVFEGQSTTTDSLCEIYYRNAWLTV